MGLLDSFEEDGIVGGLAEVGKSMLPSFVTGQGLGQGPGGVGGLFDSLKRGVTEGVNYTPVGDVIGGVRSFGQDMDPLERALAVSGLVAAPFAARKAFVEVKARGGVRKTLAPEAGAVSLAAPALPQVPQLPRNRVAGMNPRGHQILGSDSWITLTDSVSRRPFADPQRVAAGAALSRFAQRLVGEELEALDQDGLFRVTFEGAKADYAWAQNLADGKGKGNERFRKLYGMLGETPERMGVQDMDDLAEMMTELSWSSRHIDDVEFLLDPLTQVSHIEFTDQGALLGVRRASELWVPDTVYGRGEPGQGLDSAIRERESRLGKMNPRALYDSGVGHLLQLFNEGQANSELQLEAPPPRADLDAVVVDDLAYDAFVGLDTGVRNRPLNKGATSEVVANGYRQVAEDAGVPVNVVETVVREQWKWRKVQHLREKYPSLLAGSGLELPGRSTWEGQVKDPFRLDDYTLALLEGRSPLAMTGLLEAAKFGGGPSPVGDGLGSLFLLGRRGVAAVIPDEQMDVADATLRILHPAGVPTDGLRQWSAREGLDTHDERHLLDDLWSVGDDGLPPSSTVEIHHPVIHSPSVGGELHQLPANPPGNNLLVYVPSRRHVGELQTKLADFGISEVVPISGSRIQQPALRRRKLTQADLRQEDFTSPDSPAKNNLFVGISGELDDDRRALLAKRGIDVGEWDNAAQHQAVGERLRALGWDPIEQKGVYYGEEMSWLVYGMKPSQALTVGDEFLQDSIITNVGLVYGKHSVNAGKLGPITPDVIFEDGVYKGAVVEYRQGEGKKGVGGKVLKRKGRQADHVEFNQDMDNLYSEVEVEGKPTKYQVQLHLDAEGDPIELVDLPDPDDFLSEKPMEFYADLAWVRLPDDLTTPVTEKIVRATQAAGGFRPVLYTHHPMGAGWTGTRETQYRTSWGGTIAHRSRGGDAKAAHSYPAWMLEADAAWLDEHVPEPAKAVRGDFKVTAPADGPIIVNDEVRVLHNGAPYEFEGKGLFNMKVDGKWARDFALDLTVPGQLPVIALAHTAEEAKGLLASATVTGHMTKKTLELELPAGADGLDMQTLHRTLSFLRRHEVQVDRLEVRVQGSNGQVYRPNGEAVVA